MGMYTYMPKGDSPNGLVLIFLSADARGDLVWQRRREDLWDWVGLIMSNGDWALIAAIV